VTGDLLEILNNGVKVHFNTPEPKNLVSLMADGNTVNHCPVSLPLKIVLCSSQDNLKTIYSNSESCRAALWACNLILTSWIVAT
jgi:hypothetical protein